MAVGAYLRLYQIGAGGTGNPFYAATVRSMSESLHNAFFVSFDPLGTFMADKPPLALWLQTLSVLVLGYGGAALVLPQAIAGIAAIVLVFVLVRRTHDGLTALVAAATLAVLPASVLVSRNNTMDTLVMALSLGAAVLALRAASSGRLLSLVLAGVLTGLAFNTKSFHGFVASPGVVLAFWVGSELPIRRRALHLGAFAAATVLVGLSWVTAVSLVPSTKRPIVLNSDGNSIWDLTFVYNGSDRILGGDGFSPATAMTTNTPNVIPIGVLYGGERGPLRVLGEFPGPLVAAALPAALAGALLLLVDARDPRRRTAAALWVMWLAAGLVAFSASRLGSPHYLESFSPAVAACVAAAAAAAIEGGRARRMVALGSFALSGLYAFLRLGQLGDAADLIRALVVLAAATAFVSAALAYAQRSILPPAAAFVPCAALLAILFLVSNQAILDAPIEGLQPGTVLLSEDRGRKVRFDPASPAYSFLTGDYGYLTRPLSYLEERRKEGQYLAGVRSFYFSAAVIAERDVPMLPLYSEFRKRPELPIDRLRQLMDDKKVEYFLLSLPALQKSYPEAAALIRERCGQNVSRLAGVPPQTGLQLLHCI